MILFGSMLLTVAVEADKDMLDRDGGLLVGSESLVLFGQVDR